MGRSLVPHVQLPAQRLPHQERVLPLFPATIHVSESVVEPNVSSERGRRDWPCMSNTVRAQARQALTRVGVSERNVR